MKAVVCDNCGKVVLVPEYRSLNEAEGISHLVHCSTRERTLDLCDECVDKLVAAVRNAQINKDFCDSV